MSSNKKKEYDRKYYQKNKERINERIKIHNQKNRIKRNEYARKYYHNNKNKIKKYREKNHKKNKIKRDSRRKVRKEKYFNGKCCLNCGSTKNLQLHHRKPEEKEGHVLWDWNEERISVELAKCDILCHSCHVKIHIEMGSSKGENNGCSKLTEIEVIEIKKKLVLGESQAKMSRDYKVSPSTIHSIAKGKNWSHVN